MGTGVAITVVRCANCLTTLFESAEAAVEEREPCPACGSLERRADAVPSDMLSASSLRRVA
jgi:hypothetical protein